jgi:hypothetical protein
MGGVGEPGVGGVAGPSHQSRRSDQGLHRALSKTVRSWRAHHRGVVARDVPVRGVDGGDCESCLAPHDPELFGEHAGDATAL